MKQLFYLSAGSSKWGVGHLGRSIELINVLRRRGVVLNTAALVPDSNEMQKLSGFIKSYDKCIQNLDELNTVGAEGIVVDVHTNLQPQLLSWLKKQGLSVVGLDWYHDTEGVIVAKANLRGGAQASKYAIIRKEFHDAYLNCLGQKPAYDIVVVMGGGDKRRYLPKVFKFFTEDNIFSDRKIVIVLGPIAEGKLDKLSGESTGTVTILKNPKNIAAIMANASVGITNGGTSLMEFTMLGVSTIVFPQSTQEDNFIKPFIENGCGVKGILESQKFSAQVMELLENEELRKSKSKKARELIDGRGVDRIAALILKTFFSREIKEYESYSYKTI